MNQYMKHLNPAAFRQNLLAWYDKTKRDLPWRENKDPYRILVSEIMLQQTQVKTVIPYYNRFMDLFPTAADLAIASENDLLKAWEGLGYYSRARNLQASAKMITKRGEFPQTHTEILELKGVGPYTAGAVASIAFNIPAPAVDGNVFRVISRIGAIFEDIAKPKTRKIFEDTVMQLIDTEHPGDFNQALMELGATLCTPKSPKCTECPVRSHCLAFKQGIDDQLPVKSKKVKQKRLKWLVCIIENQEGCWLVRKRPPAGLLADFDEFLQFEYTSGEPEALVKKHLIDRGLDVLSLNYQGFSKHIFTHLIWEMEVYLIRVDSKEKGFELEENERWIRPEEVEDARLNTAHKRIVEQLVSGKDEF